ncbi:hypothetical protein Pint_15517 [Pistacia integerrima]|uniref:Uncharacterized protein n=1 Tax=Pistacia integerrima TaxID=434235 RepID=A0ACC0ZA50_9ROSI|nr:hypothetical protein Pint_15517 [Pistacia integerrima]
MAEALVKFFLQRLNSLLRQTIEIFYGLEHQMECLITTLGDILKFSGELWSAKADASTSSWINVLRDIIRDADDLIDEFIIQMDQQRSSDRSELTKSFANGLQEIVSRLARTIHKMEELKNSSTVKGDNESDINNPQEIEEGQTSAQGKPTAIGGEEKDNEENSPETEGSQTAEAKNSITIEEEDNKESSHEIGGQTASPAASQVLMNYTDLPYYLQSCLMYCCIFPINHRISKGKLIRLMVAEGLAQEKPGQLMEDTAQENISELINQGIIQVKDEHIGEGAYLTVNPHWHEIILCKMEEENFITACTGSHSLIPHTARHVSVYSNMTTVAPQLKNVRPRGLFFLGSQDLSRDHGNWLNFNGAKFLRILDLERTKIKRLPDEVGDLIHLTYIGLKHTDINKLPPSLGNLRALQTLDLKYCGDLAALPHEVLSLVQLRHIKMYKRLNVGGVKLPPGIERLRNILSLTGTHAGSGTAQELSNLIHLRRLGVLDVAEENVGTLVLLESFLPPPLLEKLRLEGRLERIPSWFSSMERLTKLRLGKEFCRVGGFPKLEILTISSPVLEEWTEIEDGALPRLQYLHLRNCLNLRMLPEGLQFVTTLKHLTLIPLLNEQVERLKPGGGEENYKIRYIPQISYMPMSDLQDSFPLPPCTPTEEGDMLG